MSERNRQSYSTMAGWVVLVISLIGATNAFAQTPAGQDTVLPDLAPREVEILGNLEIVFPTLRRQPLTGFNPPPRIYQIPRGREPYAEPYKQPAASLPGSSLIQPASPPKTISVGQNPYNGELSFGFGRYLSREVRLQTGFHTGSVEVYVDASHDGLDSFKPFVDSEDLEAPSQFYDGEAGLVYRRGATNIGLAGDGHYSNFDLYGSTSSVVSDDPPERTGETFGFSGWVETGDGASLPAEVRVKAQMTTYETEQFGVVDTVFSNDESFVEIRGHVKPSIGRRSRLIVDGAARQTSFENDRDDADLTSYRGAATLEFTGILNGRVQLGAQVHGFSASEGYVSDLRPSSNDEAWLSPIVSIESRFGKAVSLFARNRPITRFQSWHQIFGENPFLRDASLVLPELAPLNIEGGLSIHKGAVRVFGEGGYTLYDRYLIYESSGGILTGNTFRSSFDEVNIVTVHGGVAVALPGRFSLAVDGTWRDASLEDEEQEVPNLPSFEAGVHISYLFPGNRATLQLQGRFIGERPIDRADSIRLDSYVDLTATAVLYVSDALGIFAKTKTITGETFQHWAGYPVAPWVTLGGLRFRW